MSEIPDIERRLDLWLFKESFDEVFASVCDKLKIVQRAADVLQQSTAFKQILRVILAHGNYLNGGTKKGNAYGFKMSSLRQLESIKTSDNVLSLLQVLVDHVVR